MQRSILTGILTFAFSASLFAGASAADEAVGFAPAVSTTATVSAAVTERRMPFIGADDAGLPAQTTIATADAREPAAVAESSPVARVKPMNRLRRFASGIVNRSSAIASSLTRSAMRFIGTPYAFGGTRATGFDCSGYVQHVFALLGVHLPRTADAQFDAGRHIVAAMVPGDLVFFHTYAAGVSHVGIYLGHSRFIHSSSSRGVAISSLHDSYWAPRYLGAKRVFGS